MLIDEVCDRLLPLAERYRVTEVRIGLGYAGVLLDNGRCGLAYTFREEAGEGCCVVKEAGTLAGRRASEIAVWAKSRDVIAAAVGLALLNALIEPPPQATAAGVLEWLPVKQGDTVGMVGYFGPLVEPLRRRAKALHIIERRPEREVGALPESAAAEILPRCQVVIVSATTLLNRTLDGLLDHCRTAHEVAILGPSTPLPPDVFAPRGVTLLSGIEVIDASLALRIVSEGGGTRQLGGAVRKLAIRLTDPAR